MPIPGVIRTWVLVDRNKRITDLCSFYHLPSSIIGHPKHKTLHAVYSYYNVATSITMHRLMEDLLTLAYNAGADVFNCLDVMDNASFFDALKFGQGDGFLHYYVYNWRCPQVQPNEVGLVLV